MHNTFTKVQVSDADIKPYITEHNHTIDKVIQYFLVGYFFFGLFLSFFYDTWLVGIGIGSICILACFFTKAMLPHSSLFQYVVSAVLAVFMAQFIYQMHGMFEMHCFAFLGAVLLIAYQNWKLQLPLILLVVIHHASFAYIQYSGYKEIYFIQQDNMPVQAFLFHILLAAAVVFVCGLWAYFLHKKTIDNARNTILLKQQVEITGRSMAFAEAISQGELDVNYSFEQGDELGQSLFKMRTSLLTARQKEVEDRFVNIGITEVGHILRTSTQDISQLSIELIKKIIKYMEVNQGGLFVAEGEDKPQLVLQGCYAFDRVKYLKKVVNAGDGLLGQTMLEKDTLYMTDLPQNYIQITSGLGKSNPRSLLIVPLKNNEQIVGAIELASFDAIPAYKIHFMEKIAENIAAAVITARNNQQTAALLGEVQIINEQMRAQEEEMRQNMEELQATQEEMERKIAEYETKVEEKEDKIRQLEQGQPTAHLG